MEKDKEMVVKAEVDAADYEDETRAAARRLFEAWKRALDATIEVPDREPAINALSSSSSSCRGKRVRMRERERQGEDRETRGRDIRRVRRLPVERAGFVCL